MNHAAEITIPASAVSRGIAVGPAVCLYGRRRQYFRAELDATQIDGEARRFRAAVRLAVRQLSDLGRRSANGRSRNAPEIMDFHRLLLADESLLGSIEAKIRNDRINAEWAVKSVTDEVIAQYRSISDDRTREKHADLEDVAERLLTALGGGRRPSLRLEPGAVIVARELNPSAIVELADCRPAAIVTEHGGWTSHTFILAREIGLPGVTGVKRVLSRIRTGDIVMVDGFRGEVTLSPSQSTIDRGRAERQRDRPVQPGQDVDDLRTLDGRRVVIRANADISGGFEKARAKGALGIGLYRSEYLFNQFRGIPSEAEQLSSYRQIAESAGRHGVRIRTFDFSEDDVGGHPSKYKNPALGLRAIRLSLSREGQFRIQLRALLQAAYKQNLDIIVPMVSDLSEVRRTKEILTEERENLIGDGLHVGNPRIGAMIEVPAAVFSINDIVEEVEFICLGTNDLVQYILAVDRDNESVAKWFNTLNPAVIKAIKLAVSAADGRGIPCIVCGEMAGSPFYVPLLVGLGATELSMNAGSISRVRRIVEGIAYEEALELASAVEKCRTADEAEAVVFENIDRRWAHLFGDEDARYAVDRARLDGI